MKPVSNIALAAALALGAVVALPASAQEQQAALGKEERAALLALGNAIQARDYGTATSALAAAQAAARSGYGRYLASSLQLKLGIDTNNIGLQQTAIDSMIGSGAAPAASLPALYRNQAALLQQAGKLDQAEAAYTRVLELAPADQDAMIALAQVKHDRKKVPEAVALIDRAIEARQAAIDRAIEARQAAGQPVPQSWYKRGIHLAVIGKMAPQTIKFSRGLVAAYPTPVNWRDAAFVYRDAAQPDPAMALDSWRLARAADALAGERDYLAFANALNAAGFEGEAKAVLDEGVAAKMVDPAQPASKALIAATEKDAAAGRKALAALHTKAMAAATGTEALSAGDAHLAYGDYAKATALYQAALAKGSVDPALANTHLGIALAMAGRKAEAEAAFRAVNGPRGDLASLWLVWLAQRA